MKNDQFNRSTKATCPDPGDIAACVTGELGIVAKQAMDGHLQVCPECRKLAGALGATVAELREQSSMQSSNADLAGRILDRIPADAWNAHVVTEPAVSFSFGMFLRLAACFAILAGTAAGIWSWRQTAGKDVSAAGGGIAASGDITDNKAVALKGTLQWFASVQEPSGRWDSTSWGGKKEYSLALNGLVLLTFARDPEARKENGHVIDRAVKYMVSCQKENGLFGEDVEGMMYNHGIVTVALLEAYAGSSDPVLKAALDKAISFIRKKQQPGGGWGYSNRPDDTANTSVAVWQLQALLISAKLGWTDQEQSLRKGLAWLGSMIDDGGQFGYERPQQSPEGTATLTAMGALCMFAAADGELPGNRAVLLRLKQALAASKNEKCNSDYYRAYFLAAAFKAAKTVEHDRMLTDVQRSVLAMQEHSGGNAGSWVPGDRWSSVGGRIYSTAVAALTLELN